MNSDDRRKHEMRTQAVEAETERAPDAEHMVFDFTGLERPDVTNLALILTARLSADPGESVWVRALPWHTARVLEAMRLDHLFLHYPDGSEELN